MSKNIPSIHPVIRSVCVFCGSGPGTDPAFVEGAHSLGKALAENGIKLVYGGGSHGLMGEVARATLEHGGYVIGIIPGFLKNKERMLEGAQEMIETNDMHERKRLMYERSDAFVALPGGVGTLEELVEQLTWRQLNRHQKPILLADIHQFWKPLLVLFAHMRAFHFIREGLELPYLVAEKVGDILPMLEQDAKMRALKSS